MPDLERALQIAVQAHVGQEDKSGAPYIFHPIRVMMLCTHPNAKIVALLHDVVEDTPATFEDIAAAGFSPNILATLRLVTHAKDVPYEEYIDGLMADPVAVEVKIADLEDNSDIRRLREISDRDVERLRRYLRAHQRLTAARDSSLSELHASSHATAAGADPVIVRPPKTVQEGALSPSEFTASLARVKGPRTFTADSETKMKPKL